MLPKTIPDKLPGAVLPQYVRCGKPNCRCVRGRPHGPYWYRFYRDDYLRLRKEYVRMSDVEATQAACARWRAELAEGRQVIRRGEQVFAWLRSDREGQDTVQMIEEVLALPTMLESLYQYAEGGKGDFRLQTRALRVLLDFAGPDRKPSREDFSYLLQLK